MEQPENLDISDLYTFFKDYDLQYFKNNHNILDIIKSFLEKYDNDQAFYIVDLSKIIHQYYRWMTNLPNVKPYYAIKCNPNIVIIELLAKLGCNFDCASRDEISQVLSANVAPERIIFANPIKASSQIKYARQEDIDLLTFDSISELYKIKLYHPKAKLLVRIKIDDSKSVCRFGCKFGASADELENMFTIAKACDLNIIGVSFHVGSNCYGLEMYSKAIYDAKCAFELAKRHGFIFSVLDIGGGFPANNEKLKFEDIASTIKTALDECFGIGHKNVEVIAEPGRYMVSLSHTLVLNVIGKKENVDKETGEKTFKYYLNDGVYGSYNCIHFDYAEPKIYPYNERDGTEYKSVVFGPTCDSMDTIDKQCLLPDLAIGEWVYSENMGAYTISSSSANFNGFKPAKCYYCITENK
jgi:ornithine decarboxylase